MASAEGGLVPRGVEYGEGCPFHSRLEGLGERRQLPSGVSENDIGVFWRPQQDALFAPIWQNLRGTICISAPPPVFQVLGGDLSPRPPRDLRPWTESWILYASTYSL